MDREPCRCGIVRGGLCATEPTERAVPGEVPPALSCPPHPGPGSLPLAPPSFAPPPRPHAPSPLARFDDSLRRMPCATPSAQRAPEMGVDLVFEGPQESNLEIVLAEEVLPFDADKSPAELS